MIVVDAAAAVAALLNSGPARELLSKHPISIPHLADSEVASALRRMTLKEAITASEGQNALAVWSQMGMKRHPAVSHLNRIWQLRHNLSAYDATYVALAEAINCQLVTADGRLAAAPLIRCPVLVVEPGMG